MKNLRSFMIQMLRSDRQKIMLICCLVTLWTLTAAGMLFGQQDTPAPAAAQSQPSSTGGGTGMESTGSVDIGYRWNAGFQGNEDMYRSIVNLGQGPRLLGANLYLTNPLGTGKYVDRLQFNASAWGGDPYNTARLLAEKTGVYQFSFDYRNIDYFNFIPSYANPLLSQGIFIGQHSFDSTRRTMDFQLTLRPGKTVSPFIAYSRNSGFGPGITTFTGDGNEFPVHNQLRDTTDYYRGGVNFSLPRVSLVLEQGFLVFKDDQHIYQLDGNNLGNRRTPLLGETLVLNQLDENYHTRGNTPVSRVQVVATPWDKLTLAGKFVYSQPSIDFDYDRRTVGNFLSFDVLRAFTGEYSAASGDADRPHVLGDFNMEYRPHSRVRILEQLTSDHFRVTGGSSLARSLTGTRPLSGPPDSNNSVNVDSSESSRFLVGLNQNQVESVINLTSRLTVRGGYRYVWSNTELQSFTEPDNVQTITLHRNIALAGFGFRLPRKANLSLDFESGSGDRVYTRTDILDYKKARVRGRYIFWDAITVSGSVSLMDHNNSQPDLGYDFKNRGYNVAVAFAPNNGKRLSASLEYSKSDLNSDILFIIPQLLTSDRSTYIEDSQYGGLNVDVGLVRSSRLSFGYGVLSTTGSRPLNYHQPHAGLIIPITKLVAWTTEWRYYGYNEKGLSFQDFHNHLITAGLRFSY